MNLNHLVELRRRALYTTYCFLGLFISFFLMANPLFHMVVNPLLAALPLNQSLIATQITSPIMTPVKLAMYAALLCATPFALVQSWLFIKPGLYPKERKLLHNAMLQSTLLFVLGLLFCFFIVLPLMFHFFAANVPFGVNYMPDMSEAVNFICNMLLLFGLIFQIPLLCIVLVRLNWLAFSTLHQARPYVYVAFFTLGMLLTPPDVLSQILLALPMCILYEMGLFLAKRSTQNNELSNSKNTTF